uniref:Mitochondrial carrier protein n=1 Tax=Aplanochytrium stocchinoi TaxID=215587 RepID=A0A7S3LS03_9STRA
MGERNVNIERHTSGRRQGLFVGSESKDVARDLFAGIISGFVCKTVEYPLDTVKVLLQAESGSRGAKFTGPIDCLTQTYKKNGVFGLYRGLTSPLLGAMAENATLFVANGFTKRVLNVQEHPTLKDPVPMWKYIISGGTAGICVAFVLTPVELIKCRLQVQNAATGEGAILYKGPLDCLLKIVKADGFTGLWKGHISCLAREIPGNMAWFGTYEFVKTRVIQRFGGYERLDDVPLGWTMAAGACAGVAYWGVPYPADTVKSKIQTVPRFSSMSFVEVFKTVVREEGLAGLYKGCGITCARAAPSHALLFFFYELSSNWLASL